MAKFVHFILQKSFLLPPTFNHTPVPWQLAILVFTTIAVDTVVLSSYAFLAQKGLQSFRRSRISAWLERVFGAALVFFGFRLLLSRK